MDLKPLTVTELTQRIKRQLEVSFDQILLQGELSNLAFPRSGHVYFNLKDETSQIAAVMFRSAACRVKFALENGLEVILKGRVTVYGPRGVYQVIVDSVEPLGAGALQLAFEQLKAKLEKEGLFEPEQKKQLPFIPRGIGVVTSPTGAAIQDILNILNRRFPEIPILINPVAVQGDGAAAEIAAAIDQFQDCAEVDLLIVGRGGGSVEDLWAFNEEVVARAIYASRWPVISAVGHETDFTIADFVADLRAPTPSAAAELAVPLKADLQGLVQEQRRRLRQVMARLLGEARQRLEQLAKRLRSPRWVIQTKIQRVDDLQVRLEQALQLQRMQLQNQLQRLEQQLLHQGPQRRYERCQNRLLELEERLRRALQSRLEKKQNQLVELTHVLDSVSPLGILKRGYAAVTDDEQNLISSVETVQKGSGIRINVPDGVIHSRVEKVTRKKVTCNK